MSADQFWDSVHSVVAQIEHQAQSAASARKSREDAVEDLRSVEAEVLTRALEVALPGLASEASAVRTEHGHLKRRGLRLDKRGTKELFVDAAGKPFVVDQVHEPLLEDVPSVEVALERGFRLGECLLSLYHAFQRGTESRAMEDYRNRRALLELVLRATGTVGVGEKG